MFKKDDGFTLIEVLIVVVIIGLISNMAMVNFSKKTDEARDVVNQGNIVNIMTAIELYEMDNEKYPDGALNPLNILLGEEGENVYLRMKEEDLAKYKYTLSSDKKSYTIDIEKGS